MIDTPVLPVHIHIHRRVDHRVVQRRVQHAQLVGRTFSLNHGKFPVPLFPGYHRQGFKILSGSLCPQILQGPARADSRKSHFHFQFRIVLEIKIKKGNDTASSHFREIIFFIKPPPKTLIRCFLEILVTIIPDRLRESDREIGIIRPSPSPGDPIPRQQSIILDTQVCPQDFPVIVIDPVE